MPRTPNTRLALLLQAAGWNPSQLATALRGIAAEEGLTLTVYRTTARRWLDGAQPRPPIPALLLECLSRRLSRRITAYDAGLTRAPAVVVDPAWEVDPMRKLAHLTRAELDPHRRALLGAGVFAATALALPSEGGIMSAAVPDGSAPADRRAGPSDLEQLGTMAAVFATAADRHGGQRVRAALAAYLAHEVTPLLDGPARTDIHHGLLSATAQLTLLLGSMCADSGHHALAQHYQQIAARLATDAGDHTTLAITLRTMATHAHDLGHHTPAVLHLAEQADRHARHAPPAVRAYTHIHLAVLHAHHDRYASQAALARAERFHTQTDTAPGPFSSYPAGALHYQRAQTLTTLGDDPAALTALTTSLRLRTSTEQLPAALTRARLAETHLRLGHLDAALTHWRAFLDTYPSLKSARADERLTAALQCLRPHQRHADAADFLGRVTELTRPAP
ncbi:tol-pal system YbgF family protein [Streptomyces sp. NPDC051963]|uniref:tol-pal system YbgF family protein n=1 Tax=Streptomyces sp. NPDC051963 TaxID=3365678 RepID=UPI0037D914C4